MAVRIAACMYWADDLAADRDAYLGIAQGIAEGRGYSSPGSVTPTAYRPPVYPLLLAGAGAVLFPALATAIVNLIAGVVTVFATWGMTRQILTLGCSEETAGLQLRGFGDRSALLAAGLVAVDPLLVRYTAQPMTECAFAALVAVALWLLLVAMKSPERWNVGIAAGVLLGLAALCRPTIWPFAALAPAILWPRSPASVRQLGIVLAGLLLTVAPWAIRNAIVLGKPRLTTTHGGYTLLLANNPVFYNEVARQPWGAVWSRESLEAWQQTMLAEVESDLGPSPGEVATDRWQAARARRHIQDDPSGFAAAVLYRLRSFWNLSPRNDSDGRWRGLVAVWYAGLFAAAVVGAWRLARLDVRSLMLFLLLVISIQAVHLIYWTDTRMRSPLHPVFAVLAAVAVKRRERLR